MQNDCRGEIRGGGTNQGAVQAHAKGAELGQRRQEVVYTFKEDMTLKAEEAIKMVLVEGPAGMAHGTYHVHLHTGDTWHFAFPGDDGMEGIPPLPDCVLQGNGISALANVVGEWVHLA